MTRGQVGDLYWHVHHDLLAEVLTQPIKKRIAYINTQKPLHERSVRFRWMTPIAAVDDPEVIELDRAWAERGRAGADLDRAWADRDRMVAGAWAVYTRAWADFTRAQADFRRAWADLEQLHATEHPGCPWDGRTLFPKVTP